MCGLEALACKGCCPILSGRPVKVHAAAERTRICIRRYDDAYAHQNVFGPLVKMEGDYDKQARESQAKQNITVRWDVGLNQKTFARFVFNRDDSSEMRLVPGARPPPCPFSLVGSWPTCHMPNANCSSAALCPQH